MAMVSTDAQVSAARLAYFFMADPGVVAINLAKWHLKVACSWMRGRFFAGVWPELCPFLGSFFSF